MASKRQCVCINIGIVAGIGSRSVFSKYLFGQIFESGLKVREEKFLIHALQH